MSTRGQKKKAGKEPSSKKQKVGIDMTKIPASLRNEGYTSDYEEEKGKAPEAPVVIPDYLKCPVCKELFINPEMFGCGHTVCKMCIERSTCPVCKGLDTRAPVPNYILNQLIEGQYPEKKQQRQKELDEVVELRKKVALYPVSTRYSVLSKQLSDLLTERKVISYKDIFDHLSSSSVTSEIKSTPKETELKYFLSLELGGKPSLAAIGEYIVHATDFPSMMEWAESKGQQTPKGKKRKANGTVDHLKMLPLLLVCLTRSGSQTQTYERLSKLYDVDIGKEIPQDEWKNQPSYWIKGVDLGEIQRPLFEPFRCSCGMHHGNPLTDEEDYYSSDSEF